MVALVRMRLNGYLIVSGVLGPIGAERLREESEEAGITGIDCLLAVLIPASNVHVVSWKSGSTVLQKK